LSACGPSETPRSPGRPDLRLHIVARGKIGRSPEAELVDRYVRRIAWPFKLTELPDSCGTLPASLSPSREVLLDERGRQLSSEEFAALLGRWRDEGVRETRFLIGAADGHGEAARGKADLLLAFGGMTWPHLLARAMLAEQLWRATSILAGHPYHRSG
jgi:23S rRNA (pseudouridine1915-N3)-methyltransferase